MPGGRKIIKKRPDTAVVLKNWKKPVRESFVKSHSKVCTVCADEKPIDEFDPQRNTPDGKTSQCSDCRRRKAARKREEKRMDLSNMFAIF